MNTKLLLFLMLGLPFYVRAEVPAVVAADTPTVHMDQSSEAATLSVYNVRPWVDGPILGVASLGATLPVLFQKRLVHKTHPGDPNDENSFDRPVIGNHSEIAGWVSHVTVSAAIGLPILLDYKDVGWSRTLAEDFMVYAEVLAIDSSINNLARYSVQRPRPEAYTKNPPPTDPGSYLSFDAGHVASTVAAMSAASMTYGYRYGHRAWPWVLTGVVGIGESALRTAAGKHFYTDDILGIAVGMTVGTVVPWLHHREGPSSLTLVPVDHGAKLAWHKNF